MINSFESSVYIGGHLDRRKGEDRRNGKHYPFNLSSLRGNRSRGRRKEDQVKYVDRYDTRFRLITIGILLLCVMDAFFTLRILELGGTEENPLMAYLIEWDLWIFVYSKLIITAVCIGVLLAHSHLMWLRVIRISYILYTCFACYLALIIYEIFLLYQAYTHMS